MTSVLILAWILQAMTKNEITIPVNTLSFESNIIPRTCVGQSTSAGVLIVRVPRRVSGSIARSVFKDITNVGEILNRPDADPPFDIYLPPNLSPSWRHITVKILPNKKLSFFGAEISGKMIDAVGSAKELNIESNQNDKIVFCGLNVRRPTPEIPDQREVATFQIRFKGNTTIDYAAFNILVKDENDGTPIFFVIDPKVRNDGM